MACMKTSSVPVPAPAYVAQICVSYIFITYTRIVYMLRCYLTSCAAEPELFDSIEIDVYVKMSLGVRDAFDSSN